MREGHILRATAVASTLVIAELLGGSAVDEFSSLQTSNSATAPTAQPDSCAPQRRLSPIYSALEYAGMPTTYDLAHRGIERIYVVYDNPTRTGPPDEAATRNVVRSATLENPSPVIVIDLEVPEYPFDIRTSSKADVDKTIAYVSRLVDVARDENPRARVGVYGVPPLGDYWIPNLYVLADRLEETDPLWKAKLPGSMLTTLHGWRRTPI